MQSTNHAGGRWLVAPGVLAHHLIGARAPGPKEAAAAYKGLRLIYVRPDASTPGRAVLSFPAL